MRRYSTRALTAFWLCSLMLSAYGCPRALPTTQYYMLVPPDPIEAAPVQVSIAVEQLHADAAYGEERIVYRPSPYRLSYYEYHRWSAAPPMLVADYLQQALVNTGLFARVTRQPTADVDLVLGGHILALEEVNVTSDRWLGRADVELNLTDARSGELVWSQRFREDEPLEVRSPEGLAQALSLAMARIVAQAAPAIAQLAEEAQRHGSLGD